MDTNSEVRVLRAKIAHLQSEVDILETELTSLNDMLVRSGFPEGVASLRETVEELLAEDLVEWEQRQSKDC
jgi:hypothetical protein